MSGIALKEAGRTVELVPLGWGVVDVRPTTDDVPGASLGVVEPARGGRLARPACGCAPLLTATAIDGARWLTQHIQQHHGKDALR